MMGRLERDQEQLFYSFCLEEVVPDDHQVRAIATVLDLSWVYGELSPLYPALGRPSIDPVLMIRMLILGYAFGLRSERLLCREVRVNLAYRWFCGLSIEDKIPDHFVFSRARNERLLAQIDPRPYQAQLDQMTATRDRDQAQLTNALANQNRYTQLAGKGYATPQLV